MNDATGVPSRNPATTGVLLVTGASRGIGAATALLAARRGYAVAVNYRHDERSATAVIRRIEADGGKAIAIRADVAREGDVLAMFDACAEQLGHITGLVNNAGILEQQAPFADMDIGRIRRVFETNVFGTMLCAREAVRRMATSRGGSGGAIVNVSSAAARLGSPHEYVDYAASKGAIDTLTLGLAKEVASEGIRVNAVRPGFIETGMHASGGEPGRIDRIKGSIPLRRGGQPEEVAEAILWLLSAASSYSTGTFIDVCGGR